MRDVMAGEWKNRHEHRARNSVRTQPQIAVVPLEYWRQGGRWEPDPTPATPVWWEVLIVMVILFWWVPLFAMSVMAGEVYG